ncbi:MAG: DUF4145 domain-containing protein [Methylococcales bacterium]|nr:DUF4145 domain-containing protein [Methylococcales bacterium]
MNPKIWKQSIGKNSCPKWPCPICQIGTLSLVKDSLIYRETIESKRKGRLSDDLFDHCDTTTYAFTAWAECKQSKCKQLFSISGKGDLKPVQDYEGGIEFEKYFFPLVCFPMPDMINFPAKCPQKVEEELRAAFAVFWLDHNACANKIRVALENLMDHIGVHAPNLHQRLEIFAKENLTMTDKLMALKWLGNSGTHGEKVTKDDLLSALEIFEHVLIELIDKRSDSINEKTQKLTEKYGCR